MLNTIFTFVYTEVSVTTVVVPSLSGIVLKRETVIVTFSSSLQSWSNCLIGVPKNLIPIFAIISVAVATAALPTNMGFPKQ